MSAKFLHIVIWCISFTVANAQSGSLAGSVRSRGVAVEYASVTLIETSHGTMSDPSGKFSLDGVPYGTYVLQISSIGFKPRRMSVRVNRPLTQVNVELDEEVYSLDNVVITGTMKEVGKLRSPIPVEVYAPSLFSRNPTPNIFESLNIINGVQPQINCNVCNTGDIHINGLEGPYTMVLIDGMPIVSSLSTVYGLSGIPNNLVKRIEVVKGPASTLYGSEAVGGVINIITRDPTSVPFIQTDLFATSVGELNLDVSLKQKLGKATSLLGLNHFRYDLRRDINNDNFTDIPLQNRISVFNKWDLPMRNGKASSLAWRYFHENRWGGEMQWSNMYRGSDVYYGESVLTNRWEVIGTHPVSSKEDLSLDYSYNYHLQDSYYGTVKYLATQHVAFAQLRWSKHVGAHDILVGMPFRFIHYDDNTPGTAELSGANAPAVTWLPGLFVQDEWQLSSRFSTLAGIRYDHHNIHGSILTPRLSLKYAPDGSSVIRLTGGNGYRVVNLFTEDHAALTGSREVVIAEELRPEQSWNVNLNYSRNFTVGPGFLNIDGSLFYTYFTNKIVGDFLSDPDKIIYENLTGYAVSKGLTLNADLQFASGWSAMAGVTVMDVYTIDQETGDSEKIPQLFAPRFSGTLSVNWSPQASPWKVDLTGRFNGPMYLPVLPNDFRPEKSPLVPLINLQATRVFASAQSKHEWEIYAGIKNLLNFIPGNPLMRPFDPFDRNIDVDNPNGYTFDTAYNYAPLQGLRGFVGVRYTLH